MARAVLSGAGMRTPLLCGSLLSALAISGCGLSSRLEVAPYRQPCSGWEGQTSCLMVREPGSLEPYALTYERFEGFTPSWGVTYVIELAPERSQPYLLEDAPAAPRRLLRIVSEDPADGATFDLTFSQRPDGVPADLTLTSATGGTLLGEAAFACSSEALCDDVRAVLEEPAYQGRASFAFVSDWGGTRLELRSVESLP